jgi:hypothetical protein
MNLRAWAIGLIAVPVAITNPHQDTDGGQRSQILASSGQLRLTAVVATEKQRGLELCKKNGCSSFVCAGYDSRPPDGVDYYFHAASPWPGRQNVALIEYVQGGSGSIASFERVTLADGTATCETVEPPEPSKRLPDDEDQYWGVYDLDAAGHLEFRAGGSKKGRVDTCHACRPDTVLRCTWQLSKAGFVPKGCATSVSTE